MIKLFPYQQTAVDAVFEKFETKQRALLQAATGAGKTYMFSYIAKRIVDGGQKVVILCHREELVGQTISTLSSIGVRCQSVTPETKRLHTITVDVYVCMIETVYNRLKRGKFSFDDVGLVIADECHVRVFEKCYDYFPDSKILGVTATPVHTARETFFKCKYCKTESPDITECCGEEIEEWSKPFTFSQIYDDIVVGPPIKELIEFGQLVPEVSFVRKYADTSKLKVDATGEYTTKSLNDAYGNENASFNVLLNYMELCKGKRTIIFNSSAKVNKMVYDRFIEAGVNAKIYDSVNETEMSRKELVKWFSENDDAVLLNVNVFVAGFDNRDVQAIMANCATKSLSKFLQMVGRGGRSSNNIFKEDFIFIDGGENIAEFGEWSSDRDWEDIFWNGIGKPKPKKIMPDDIQDCPQCGYLFDKYESECPGCGHVQEAPPPKEKKEVVEGDEVLEPIRKIPPPSGRHIYEYTKRKGENINFAFRTLQNRMVDMFKYWRVSSEKYRSARESGELDRKIRKHILPAYFFLIKQQDIQTGQHRTIDYMVSKTKDKLEKYYDGR